MIENIPFVGLADRNQAEFFRRLNSRATLVAENQVLKRGCLVRCARLAKVAAVQVAHIMVFTYYGYMNITLSIDEDLVKQVRKIAVERDTTLTGLVRAYLRELAAEDARSGRKRREMDALERSFEQLQIHVGERTWKREDLYKYERS